jgi:hypothetical protein
MGENDNKLRYTLICPKKTNDDVNVYCVKTIFFLRSNEIFNVFQMAITVDEMRAAQAVTGFTPEERRIRNILNALPQVRVLIVQCLYHRELQLSTFSR